MRADTICRAVFPRVSPNNGRPGNLLTQAIATSDPDDFGMMRPAQLFGALNWRLEKAPGQRIDRWPSPLAITPEYEAEALRDMIRADAWAVEHFAQFLTMVEEVTSDNPKAPRRDHCGRGRGHQVDRPRHGSLWRPHAPCRSRSEASSPIR